MLQKFWNLLCSLKLAIYLASVATLLLMGGSLYVPFNQPVFGNMDQLPFAEWLSRTAQDSISLTWWFWLASLFMILFGINTLCCFLDWLFHLKARWRKSGEYLLHLGVVLVIVAYIWGSVSGWRNGNLKIMVGEAVPLEDWPGYTLRLDDFKPVFGDMGPPLDMISDVTILHEGIEYAKARVAINSPLLRGGLVVTPVSFGQEPTGLKFSGPGGQRDISAGERLDMPGGATIDFVRFIPDVRRQSDGRLSYRSDRIGTPAYEINIRYKEGGNWQGLYFPTASIPYELRMTGFNLKPVAPVYSMYSLLTVNYDPGAPLASVGGGLMTIGVFIALFSFYRKRARQDRPEV